MALLEQVTYGVTSIVGPIESVEETVNELSTVNPRTYRTGYQQQFEVTSSMYMYTTTACPLTLFIILLQTLNKDSSKEQDFQYTEAISLKNHTKNRNQKPLPRKNM